MPPEAASLGSSHMMKTTKRGRPFLKDTLDLFATLIVSLELTSNKQFFRTFHNSFTTCVHPVLPTLPPKKPFFISHLEMMPPKFGLVEVLAVKSWSRSTRTITDSNDDHDDHFLDDSGNGKGNVPTVHGCSPYRKRCRSWL
ncbi:hypothetical protein AcW2_006800 [Taiwanofungus camphoratus]|nr:hypothetical protein AcW2_006800 [Antrodia cinnamomea]